MSEDNFEISKQHNLIAMRESKKTDIDKMKVGDVVVFYIPKKAIDSSSSNEASKIQTFQGIAKITSETFSSDEPIWRTLDNDTFPHRKKIEFIDTALNTPIRPLIERLSFVTNTAWWALPLRRGYVEINRTDLDVIRESASA